MIFYHAILQGFTALWRQKVRAILTMLGIIIGIGAVTGMVSVSEGLNTVVLRQLEKMGLGNTIICWRDEWIQREDGRWVRNRTNAYLTYADALAIPQDAPSVEAVLPEVSWEMPIEYGGRTKRARIVGTTPEYEEGHNWHVEEGRFLTYEDVDREEKIAIIGRAIQDDLFPGENPIGKYLTVRRERFRIVGLMTRKAADAPDFTGTNNTVILPLTTYQQRFMNRDIVWVFFIRATSAAAVPKALLEVKAILSRRKGIPADEAFRFFTSDEVIRAVAQISFVLKSFLVGVASIALVVGGVGIMNMMLVTVTERTHEIGLRKAVGAHRRHILYQFLIESVVLGTVGGGFGILLGAGIGKTAALLITMMMNTASGGSAQIDWPAVVSFDAAFLAMAISAAIGVVAGLFPAFRAALLPPTEALHHE